MTIDGRAQLFSAGALHPDVPARQISVRGPGGTEPTSAGGDSAAQLLRDLGLTPGAIKSFAVLGGPDGPIPLEDHLLTGYAGDPVCPAPCPATFDPRNADGPNGTISFFRPLADAGDVNWRDRVTSTSTTRFQIAITSNGGSDPLGVVATASTTTPGQREVVQFHATSPGGFPDGTTLLWDFGDGATGTGPDPAHAFVGGAPLPVSVSAIAPDLSSGSAALTITPTGAPAVVAPPAATPGAGGAAGSNLGAATGGNGSGTGAPVAGSGASSRGTAGAAPPAKPRPTKSKRPPRRKAPEKAGATPAPAASPALAVASPIASVPGAASGSAASPGTAPATPAATTPPATTPPAATPGATTPPATTPAAALPPGASGTPISGLRVRGSGPDLAAALAAAQALASEQPPAAPDSRARNGGGSGSALGWAGGGLALVLLAGLGAAREGVRVSGRRLRLS